MHLTSLGYQTDLALLSYGESVIDDKGEYVVVTTPTNPKFWWGNFILLPEPPPPEDAQHWLDVFAEEIPYADHVAMGFDGVDGTVADLAAFSDLGLKAEGGTVMTATSVHAPPRPNSEAVYRPMESDADWQQVVDLRVACKDEYLDDEGYVEFTQAQAATRRQLVADGRGQWFGAFVDGTLLSQMGLFTTRSGLARFQSVETHPDARGQGLAGTLVHAVSRYGFDQLGVNTLVMVADPDYLAIKIYRSVGFDDTETQLQVERPPGSGSGEVAAE